MKLLEQYQSTYDAERVALELRRKGILAQVSDKFANPHSFASGAFKVGLWVIVDEQFDDAFSVLNDQDYEVQNPLTEVEMIAIEQAAAVQSRQLFAKAFDVIASSMIVVAIVVFIVHAIKENW